VTEARHITDLGVSELAEVERVEAELDSFVEKRAREARDAGRVEELWDKTVREYREKRHRANAEEWFDFHDNQIRSHVSSLGVLVSYHKRERAKYARILGLPEVGPGGEAA
jgi:hypothetical protein